MASFSLNLSLDADVLADLNHDAKSRGISVQDLIRTVIGNYVSMKEEKDSA